MTTSKIPPPPPPKSHAYRNGLIIAIVVAIVVGSVLALSFRGSGGSSGSSTTPQNYSSNIVNGLITVNAGGYEYYQFTVPSGAANVQVQGSFTASGGSGNDIIVLIMDSTDFINWENGHQASAYYNSGQLTTSNIDVTLPAGFGTYYLVYSNTFSIISQKNVNTQVQLSYTI